MSKIYVVPIEPIDTRYTRQWYENLPVAIEAASKANGTNHDVVVVDGDQVPPVPTPGAFLDFGATNIYKSSQLAAIADEFQHGRVKPGDKFLFTDAWNPSVISVKYMSSLLNIPVELHGMWHAGSYDPQDFLGRLIGDAKWVRTAEQSMFHCYDSNWFATDFHINLFIKNLFGPFYNEGFEKTETELKSELLASKKIAMTGWPMDYLYKLLEPYSKLKKKNSIVFPHRLAPEKQFEIFKDLANTMPDYEWIVCQEKQLTKDEYHTILGESTIVFSANQQETYGISMIEGLMCNSIPLVPNRLSYSEMFVQPFIYPSIWTESWNDYQTHKQAFVDKIKLTMIKSRLEATTNAMNTQLKMLDKFIHATPLIDSLVK